MPSEIEALYQKIVACVEAALPDTGWIAATYRFNAVTRFSEEAGMCRLDAGENKSFVVEHDATDALKELRTAMANAHAEKHAWYSATVTLMPDRNFRFDFIYDRLPPFKIKPSQDKWADEFRTYPRPDMQGPGIEICTTCGSEERQAVVQHGSYLLRCSGCGTGIVATSFNAISQTDDVYSAYGDPGFGQQITEDALIGHGPLREIADAVSRVAIAGGTVLLLAATRHWGVEMRWLTPWEAVEDNAESESFRAGFEHELRKEVGPGHVLCGLNARLIGRRYDRDTALFLLDDGRIARVHLTWRQDTEIDPRWPETTIYADPHDWWNRGLAEDHADWTSA